MSKDDRLEIINRVVSIMGLAINRGYFGPWVVLVGQKVASTLGVKHKDRKSLLDRVMEIDGIKGVVSSTGIPSNAIRLLIEEDCVGR